MKNIFFLPLIMTLLTANIAFAANGLPDVIVTSLTYANGNFKSVVKNQGTTATPVGVVVGVRYSVDGVGETWGSVNGPLAAGASVTIGTQGGSYTIPTGNHTITAWVDDADRFAESNKTNNTLSESIPVGSQSNSDWVIEGFAAADGVTGGTGGKNIVVTNLNESGSGSLQNAIGTSGTRKITFTPGLTGTINWTGNVYVNYSNMTIDGTGANITISGMSLYLFAVSNIIVQNLTFTDTTATQSAIMICYGAYNIWIDHNTFKNNSSGDTGEPIAIWDQGYNGGLTGITVSWNHFEAPNQKAILLGTQVDTNPGTARVSIHHNWMNGVSARNPRIHGLGNLIHAWNNYVYGWTEVGMAASSYADLLAENNIFENTETQSSGAQSAVAITPQYGYPTYPKANSVNASGNSLAGIAGAPTPTIGTIGTFPSYKITYSVTPDVADNALKTRIIQGAGAQ